MSDIISFQPVRALDGNGNPVPGALARFFVSGTTAPVTVFQDLAEQVPHPTPIVADANGVFPPIFRGGVALRVTVTTPAGAMLPGFPLDPVLSVSSGGAGAAQVSFAATPAVPFTNVQAAIEGVQASFAAPLLAGGIGVTGNAPVLNNVDATGTASGFYRWTDTATGTLPPGWAGNSGTVWLFRETAINAVQFIAQRGVDALFYRRLVSSTWGAWQRYDLPALADSDWTAGLSATLAGITPAQLRLAILAQAVSLSEAQVIDAASTVFGLVSGQRLDQAVAARAPVGRVLASGTFSAATAVDIPLPSGQQRTTMQTSARIILTISAASVADVALDARFTRDNFATVINASGAYRWGVGGWVFGVAGVNQNAATDDKMRVILGSGNAGLNVSPSARLDLLIEEYAGGDRPKRILGRADYINNLSNQTATMMAAQLLASPANNAVNGVRVIPSSGNITGAYFVVSA
jgi:hypothetical protein